MVQVIVAFCILSISLAYALPSSSGLPADVLFRRRDDTPKLNSQEAATAYSAISQTATSTPAQQALSADVSAYTSQTRSIAEFFSTIASLLNNIEGDYPDFASTWNSLQVQWQTVIPRYQVVNYFLSSYNSPFASIFLPYAANQTLANNVTSAISILKGVPGGWSQTSDTYTVETDRQLSVLTQGFNDFYTSYSQFVAIQNATAENQISKVSSSMASMASTIDQINDYANTVAGVFGVTVLREKAALNFLPQFSTLILGAGVQAVGVDASSAIKQMTDAQNNIAEAKAQLASLTQGASPLIQARAALESMKQDLQTISTSLGIFRGIVNSISTECTLLVSYLSSTNAADSQVEPLALWQATQRLRSLYDSVTTVVNLFATAR